MGVAAAALPRRTVKLPLTTSASGFRISIVLSRVDLPQAEGPRMAVAVPKGREPWMDEHMAPSVPP